MGTISFLRPANDGTFQDQRGHTVATVATTLYSDDMDRPEIDAKLAAAEARMETQTTRIEGKLDAAVARIEGKFDSLEVKFDMLMSRMDGLAQETHSMRWWAAGVIVTVLIAAVGTVIGVYGANASIVQSVISGFQAGQQAPPPKTGK